MTDNQPSRTANLIARLKSNVSGQWDQLAAEAQKAIDEAIARDAALARQAFASTFDRMPKDHTGPLPKDLHGTLSDLGFRVDDPVDNLFVHVAPPAGWTLKPDPDGERWSILDAAGRERGGVYLTTYPSEFAAFCSLQTRFEIHALGFQPDGSRALDVQASYVQGFVVDALRPTPLFTSRQHPIQASDDDVENIGAAMTSHRAAKRECQDWLKANYPDWQNPAAYWD